MALGVDRPFRWPGRSGLWCHLICDDFSPEGLEELHCFAARLGLRREWFQDPPRRPRPHYDLRPEGRERALLLGAQELTRAQVVEWLRRGRERALAGPGG